MKKWQCNGMHEKILTLVTLDNWHLLSPLVTSSRFVFAPRQIRKSGAYELSFREDRISISPTHKAPRPLQYPNAIPSSKNSTQSAAASIPNAGLQLNSPLPITCYLPLQPHAALLLLYMYSVHLACKPLSISFPNIGNLPPAFQVYSRFQSNHLVSELHDTRGMSVID